MNTDLPISLKENVLAVCPLISNGLLINLASHKRFRDKTNKCTERNGELIADCNMERQNRASCVREQVNVNDE